MKRFAKRITPLLILIIGCASLSQAYDLLTHEAINVGGVRTSALHTRLQSELGFPNGREEIILGKRVIDLISEGGILEDSFPRFLNHFHHPLRSPWQNAGLNDFPGFGTSSILWGQDFSQGFSWLNARQFYLTALIDPDKAKREEKFADTFRAVGQIMHLTADASVPAHVRNNSHAFGDSYENWVESQAEPRFGENREGAQQRFLDAFAPSPLRPDDSFILKLSIFGQNAADAPVPIARLWDTDQYDGTNPSITLSPRIGITEYANANFFSQATVFADQNPPDHKYFSPFPSSADVELFVDLGNNRKYWRKKGVTLDEPQHLATASIRTFWQESSGVDLQKRGRLDEKVHEEYARLLLPRAVGYSAGLLDYFFRGKLDVDLVPDPQSTDPTVVKLSGTNGSPDKLDGGTLTLYADDPITGKRTLVPALGPNFTVVADAGQPIESAKFQINTEAERFMAVYKGKLGEEKPEGDFPGGVIGKVIGGVRVEQVFLDFFGSSRWFLRTPEGVFPLPIFWPDVQGLKWGEKDNMLLGRSGDTFDQTLKFLVYEINRPESSTDVPLRTESDGTQVVDIKEVRQVPFPFGLYLGTDVHFTGTVHYQQFLPWVANTTVHTWVVDQPDDPDQPGNQEVGHYETKTQWDGQVTQAADQSASVNQDFRLTLDSGFAWSLNGIALTRDGQILALVNLEAPFMGGEKIFPVYKMMDIPPGTPGSQAPQPVLSFSTGLGIFPPTMGRILFALIDVGAGKVVASTSPSAVSIGVQISNATQGLAVRVYNKEQFIGGLRGGEFKYISQHDVTSFFQQCTPEQLSQPVMFLGEVNVKNTYEAGNTAQYGPEIAQLLPATAPDTTQGNSTSTEIVDCGTGEAANPPRAFKVNGTGRFSAQLNPPQVVQVVRPTEGSSGELVVLIEAFPPGEQEGGGGEPIESRVATWNPAQGSAKLRHSLARGFTFISSATSRLALVQSFDSATGIAGASLISVQGSVGSIDYPQGLPGLFTVIEPTFLYNIQDGKFYTRENMPRRTALPRALASFSDSTSSSSYHTVRVE